MVKTSKGFRKRTRKKLRKRPRDRGLPPVTHYFTEFEAGEKAAIVIDPSVHRGQPHPRYHGVTGTVEGRQGRAYVVRVQKGGVKKRVLATPEHLRKLE